MREYTFIVLNYTFILCPKVKFLDILIFILRIHMSRKGGIFGYDPKSGFDPHGFENRNELVHNNMRKSLLVEEIREYSVMIDSKDRNYQIYPNPFNYEVRFNPLPKTREWINDQEIISEEPTPIIYTHFKNVKYIKLDSVVFPFYTKVKWVRDEDDEDEFLLNVDTNNSLTDELYLVMTLGEHADMNAFSTNDVLSSSFATIYFDRKVSNTHFVGSSRNGIRYFPMNQLGEVHRLKIAFMDPYGKPLTVPHLDPTILSNLECECDDPETDQDERDRCFRHNLSHPLNPIFQHHINLKIGVVEPQLNKAVFA